MEFLILDSESHTNIQHAYGMYSGTLLWLSQIGYYFAFYANNKDDY